MNKKIVKRIILIGLVGAMAFVALGYKYGVFNSIFTKHNTDTSELNSQALRPATTNKSADSDKNQNKTSDLKQDIVSIIQSDKANALQLQDEEIRNMVREAIDLAGGFDGIIKDNQVVVLKPNLVQMHVDSTGQPFDKELNGVTTDWRVTKAVAEMVREYNPNGKIYVMEGSAGDFTKKTMEYLNYTKTKIPEVDEFISIEDDSGKWQDFNSSGLVKYSLPNGLLHKKYYLNKKYSKCDVLISIPCLKTNSGSVVSGAIKNVSIGATPANIYGVSAENPGRTKMVSHKVVDGELNKWIYDYYMCKPVNFVVMDGLQGFQNGPVPISKSSVTSDRMNMRLIMAGRDSIAVDTIEALTLGWDPDSIPYLKYLSESGMGVMDTSKISVVGKLVDQVRKDFAIRFSNLGGVRIQDRKPPEINIVSQKTADNILHINLSLSEKTTKVEVFVDDKLQSIVFPEDFKDINIDMTRFSGKNHKIKLMAFDKFLNHSEVTTSSQGSANKETSETDGNQYFSKKSSLLKAGDIEGLINLSSEEPSNPSASPAFYELPKDIIRLAHNKAMEKFKAKDNLSAVRYTEYGLNEYQKAFLDRPLNKISIDDITVKSQDKYADKKIAASEFILIFNNYAYFVLQTGDNEKAEELLRKVVELSPNRAVAYIDLGNACWNLGKHDEAKTYYKKYLELLGKNTKNVPPEVYERIK